MTQQEKMALLEETFEMDEGSLTPDTMLADLDNYDSMAKLSLIVMFDDEFGKKITSAEVKSFQSISDILMLMEK